tara:strand:- start:75 stop:344 length:270 start_codon:yes stop_codon:yes gene_type:complete
MKFKVALSCIFLCTLLKAEREYCYSPEVQNRSYYEIGDTLSIADQNKLFSVCNGSGNYSTGDQFKFADYNGNLNGGDYKITVISMNATW